MEGKKFFLWLPERFQQGIFPWNWKRTEVPVESDVIPPNGVAPETAVPEVNAPARETPIVIRKETLDFRRVLTAVSVGAAIVFITFVTMGMMFNHPWTITSPPAITLAPGVQPSRAGTSMQKDGPNTTIAGRGWIVVNKTGKPVVVIHANTGKALGTLSINEEHQFACNSGPDIHLRFQGEGISGHQELTYHFGEKEVGWFRREVL